MKYRKTGTALLTAILLLAIVTPASLAVNDASVNAGKTAALVFNFSDVFAMDGTFVIQDPDGIVKGHTISVTDTESVSVSVDGDHVWAVPNGEPTKTTVTVTVRVQIVGDAVAGKACTVLFSGVSNSSETEPGVGQPTEQSAKIRVRQPAVAKPVTVDLAALKAAESETENLQESDYTIESWAELSTALDNGRRAMNSKEQKEIDTATDALSKAVAGLVKIDRSKLERALEQVQAYRTSDSLAEQWAQLSDAVSVGRALWNSGDQAAIDAAADQITAVLSQLCSQMDELRAEELEEPQKESVEETICTVTSHKVWSVLFFVSVALNAGLVLVILFQKRKKITDDTPLVDYDISDDVP